MCNYNLSSVSGVVLHHVNVVTSLALRRKLNPWTDLKQEN